MVAQRVRTLPAMQETRIWSLGWEDPLEKEIATHSSILAWKIPWMEKPGRLQSMGLQRVGQDWVTSLHFKRRLGQIANNMFWGEPEKEPCSKTLHFCKISIYYHQKTKLHYKIYRYQCDKKMSLVVYYILSLSRWSCPSEKKENNNDKGTLSPLIPQR